MNRHALLWTAALVAGIVAANAALARWGVLELGPLLVPAGALFAGLVLVLRDAVHDAGGWPAVVAAIAVGAACTLLMSPQFAAASAVAFLLSEALDAGVYAQLRAQGWAKAAVGSSVAGAVLDTAVFLELAGLGLAWPLVAGQLVAKAAAVAVAVLALRRHR